MKKSSLYGAVCAYVAFGLVSIPSHAGLIDNGDGLIYDDVLNITWAQPDFFTRTWDDAIEYADTLTLGGATEWRLAYISVAEGAGPFAGPPVECGTATEEECRDNELGYMFYQNLGGTFGVSILDSGDPDLALFPSLDNDDYWSGTETNSPTAWKLDFNNGSQISASKSTVFSSWAVHEGNIDPTPTVEETWGRIKAVYR